MCAVIMFVILSLIVPRLPSVEGTEGAMAVTEKVTSSYKRTVRPVKNYSTAVNTTFGLSIRQIRDVDEIGQRVIVFTWVRMFWNDDYLQWNPEDYSGTTEILLPSSEVWHPDIYLLNNGDFESDGRLLETTNIIVQNNGSMKWNFPQNFIFSCKMDMAYFPFDDQICMMEFGSWTYHGLHLNLFNDSYIMDDVALDFGEWDVLESSWHREITYRECCAEPFPTLFLKFHLRRRILYYFINLLLPCIVLLAVNPLVFLLPAGTGERIGFCMTIQLSVVVFLQVVSEHTPQTADSIPLIEQFFTATIFLVGSTVMTNIFLLYIHYKGMLHIPVPGWMRNLVLIHLARLTGMTGTAQTFSKISPMDYVEDLIIENMDTDFDSRPPSMTSGLHKPPTTALERDDFLHQKVDLLYRKLADTTRSIDAKVRTMSRQMTRQSTQYFLTFEWRCVGLVLDRFLMYMTILVTIIISVAIFTQAPHF